MKLLITSLSLALSLFGRELVFGLDPMEDPNTVTAGYEPLVKHIEKELGQKIKIVVTRDYKDLVDRMESGVVDFANPGSNNYVQAKMRIPKLQYVATNVEMDGESGKPMPYYYSVIVTKTDAPYKTLNELNGKKFGFTDVDSTSGYVFPKALLMKNGIEPEKFFSKIFMLKKHDKVTAAIAEGAIDAGATYSGNENSYNKTQGKEVLRVLAKSSKIPLEPVVAAPHVDATTVKKLQDILKAIPAGHDALKGFKTTLDWEVMGFAVMDDSLYDGVREANSLVKPK